MKRPKTGKEQLLLSRVLGAGAQALISGDSRAAAGRGSRGYPTPGMAQPLGERRQEIRE